MLTNKYRMINTEMVRIQFCQRSEIAFDRARKYHCLQKDYDTHFFLLKIEALTLHLISKNLLFTGKNTVIKIFLFPGGVVKLMKVVYHFLMHKYQS